MASHAFLEGLALSRLESRVELAMLAFGNLFHEVLCALALGVMVASATLMAGGRAIGLCRGLSLIYLVALMPLCGFLCGALLAALANTFSLALFSTWFASHSQAHAVPVALNATLLTTTPASTLAHVFNATTAAAAARLHLTTGSLHAAATSAGSALSAAVGAGAGGAVGSGHGQAIVAAGVDPTAAVGAVLTALVLSFAAGTYLHISFLDLLARQTATSAGLFGTSGQQVGNRLLKVALCFTGFFFIALLRFIFPHAHS